MSATPEPAFPGLDSEFDRRTCDETERALLVRLEAIAEGDATLDSVPYAPFPLKLQIQTHTGCNAACIMCPYPQTSRELPGGRMSEDMHGRILAEAARHPVHRISHFLMNEPLLDRRLPSWIRRTREVVPQASTAIFSNGDRLEEDLLLALAEAGLGELTVSINGGDAETFERVNVGLSFDRILGHLDRAAELKAAGRLGDLDLQVVAVDLPEVAETFDQLARRWERQDVTVHLRPTTNRAGNVTVGDHPTTGARRRRVCQRPFVKAYIVFNGDVVLCNCDWRREVVLGNLNEESLETIWQSARYGEHRQRHVRFDFERGSICERCDYPWVRT